MSSKNVLTISFLLIAILTSPRTSFAGLIVSTHLQSGDSGPIDSYADGISIATFNLPPTPIGTVTDFQLEFTLDDGDTALGDADHGSLVLYLNGINTGVFLDGFADGSVDRLTFTSTVSSVFSTSLLASIGSGGQITATIHDLTANPVDSNTFFPNSNIVTLPQDNFGQPVIATLQIGFITAVPEPSSILLALGFGSVFAGASYRRRSRLKETLAGGKRQCN